MKEKAGTVGRFRVSALSLCLLGLVGAGGCRSIPMSADESPKPWVRFLLTFDDGPSARERENPTLSILEQLAVNDVQTNIRGIFFVHATHSRGGGTPVGRDAIRRMSADGHLIGLHGVSPLGHVAHIAMSAEDMVYFTGDCRRRVQELTGQYPVFVRPPFGASNAQTRRFYADVGLCMLLDDVSACDGVIFGFNASPRRRAHFRKKLAELRARLREAEWGPESPYPVIIAFHDVNPYTARQMSEYLRLIVEESARVGLMTTAKPFYDSAEEARKAALSRCVRMSSE